MEANMYTFMMQYYDTYANASRPFICIFHEMKNGQPNQLEMVNPKSRQRFIAKHRTKVKLSSFLIGSDVTIQGRIFKVESYNDAQTARAFARMHEPTLLCVAPRAMRSVGALLDLAQENGLELGRMKTCRMSPGTARAFAEAAGLDSLDCQALSEPGVSCAVELLGENAAAAWRGLYEAHRRSLGPVAAAAAAATAAATDFFFGDEQRKDIARSSAQVMERRKDPCTLMLIKPHALEQRNHGKIVQQILSDGRFEIAALDKVSLSKADALELMECYSFLNNVSEQVEHLSSGPCLALCLRGGPRVQQDARDLAGPFDVIVAREIRPQSLRAQFGYNRVRNAVHCTDLPEDGLLECNFFFNTLRE
jgi:nucleoside-diphosphate kinase